MLFEQAYWTIEADLIQSVPNSGRQYNIVSSSCADEIYIQMLRRRLFLHVGVVDIWHFTEESIKQWKQHIIGLFVHG